MMKKNRTHSDLLYCFEQLGKEMTPADRFSISHNYNQLKVVEIPDDVDWKLCCSGWGGEWVAEKHRTWS